MKPMVVLDGGGLKMTWGAGIFYELHRQGITADRFDSFYGTSAGACTAAYIVTGQLAEGRRIFTRHLPRKFIGWHGNSNLTYLEWIFRNRERLAIPELRQARPVYIAVTNLRKQSPEIFHLNSAADPVETLLAGVSWTRPRFVNGTAYIDGGLTCQPPLAFAEQAGGKKIWVLSVYPKGERFNPLFWKVLSLRFRDPDMRQLFANCAEVNNTTFAALEARTDVRIIRPAKPLPINWRGSDQNAVDTTFELGRQTAHALLEDPSLEL